MLEDLIQPWMNKLHLHLLRRCVLFCQFGLLLSLPRENMSLESLSLRQLLPSHDSDHSSANIILKAVLLLPEQLRLLQWWLLPLLFQKQLRSLLKQWLLFSFKLKSSSWQFLPFGLRKVDMDFIAIAIGVIGSIVIVRPVCF